MSNPEAKKNIPGIKTYEYKPPSKKAVIKNLRILASQVTPDQKKYVVDPAIRGRKRTLAEEIEFRAWLMNQ